MSDSLVFSLCSGGLRSPLLLVKPAQAVGLHCWGAFLSHGFQQGWSLDVQPDATRMSQTKKQGWKTLLLSSFGSLGSTALLDSFLLHTELVCCWWTCQSGGSSGSRCWWGCLWAPNTLCAPTVRRSRTGSKVRSRFNIGVASSTALPASIQTLAWTSPAWLKIQRDHGAAGIRGTLFSVVDMLRLNSVVMRLDLLLCSCCLALHNSTDAQRAREFDLFPKDCEILLTYERAVWISIMIYKRGLSSYSKHGFPFCRAVRQMVLVCKVTFLACCL